MMPVEYSKYEADGWFYCSPSLAVISGPGWDDGIGRGSMMSITRFRSEEGRAYFIQARQYEYAANAAAHELNCLKESLRRAVKKRSVRKRILELIG